MSIRMLMLSAALLAGGGCVSYSYHSGHGGDYYSGTPSVEYRYVGGYYGYGYGYGPYWYGGYGYPGYYGGYPYYGHRHGYHGGYGYPYWGSAYYYGGAWGYGHGPYKPPRYNPPPTVTPVNPPPRSVRYLDTPNDAKRFHHDREDARGRYGYAPPPSMTGSVQRPPSRPISPPPSRPVSPPQQQMMSPPPSTPRVVPPSRPVPATPGPTSAVTPARRADAEAPMSKGGARARSRSIDSSDP